MFALEVEIVNPTGLHTRPGNAFVKKAKEFSADILVEKGERHGNAKSLLSLLKVGCARGDRIIIRAEGADEREAVEALALLVARLAE